MIFLFSFLKAVDDVGRGHIKAADKLYELKALQEAGKRLEVQKINYLCILKAQQEAGKKLEVQNINYILKALQEAGKKLEVQKINYLCILKALQEAGKKLDQKKLITSFSGTTALHFHVPHLSFYSVN